MVIVSLGVAYLPTSLVHKFLHDGLLVSLLEDWIPPARDLHIAYVNRKHLPTKSKAFVDFMKEWPFEPTIQYGVERLLKARNGQQVTRKHKFFRR